MAAVLPGLLLAIGLAILAVPSALAFKAPAFQGDVVDEAGLLSAEQGSALKQRIRELREQDGVWAAIYVAGSLQGESIEDAAVATFEKWKLGQAGKDNGVLVLVVPSERKMRIEVGYGLEGVLTDALSKRVIDEVYKPAFRDGRFTEGLVDGFEAMARAVRGEKALPDAVANPGGAGEASVEIDGEAFLARFLGVLGINLGFPLLYVLARRYGKSKGRSLAGNPSIFGDGMKTTFMLFAFFGVIFGIFLSVFGLAFPDDPEVLGALALMNALFASFFVIPGFPLVRAYLSASAYRRLQARERLFRIRRRSRNRRKIFGVWFDPEDVPASRGGVLRESSSSAGSFSSSSSSSDSSSSSGGGRSGGGGASGSW